MYEIKRQEKVDCRNTPKTDTEKYQMVTVYYMYILQTAILFMLLLSHITEWHQEWNWEKRAKEKRDKKEYYLIMYGRYRIEMYKMLFYLYPVVWTIRKIGVSK